MLMQGFFCFFLTEQVSPPPLQTDHGRMTVTIIVGFDEVVTVREYPWLNDGISIWYPSISFSKEQEGKSSFTCLLCHVQCQGPGYRGENRRPYVMETQWNFPE